ncbi:MAG: oligosaccharide flippase family protein [Candidatus Zixiibacteriota bacterium]
MQQRTPARFFDSTVAILATQFFCLLAIFFLNLLISRHFGEAGKGYVSLVVYLAEVLFSIANLSLGFTAQYFVSKRLATPRRLFSNFVVFSLGAGILVVAVFVLTHSWWQPYLQNLELHQLLPALVLVLILLIYEPSCQLLIAMGRIGKRSAVLLTQNYLILALLVVLLLLGTNQPLQVVWLHPLSYGIAAVLLIYFVVRQSGPPNQPSLNLFKETMKYGSWIYVANLLSFLVGRADFFMLTALGSLEAAGVYSVAAGLTSPLLMVSLAVHTVFYPKTSSESDADAAITTPFYYRQAIIVLITGALGLAICARPVLGWYGEGFIAGLAPMFILLVAAIIRGLNGILTLHILGRGKSYIKSLTMFCSLIVAVGVNYLLIPKFGMIGAALGLTSAVFLENIILTALYRVLVNGRIGQLYRFNKNDLTASFREGIALLKRMRSTL